MADRVLTPEEREEALRRQSGGYTISKPELLPKPVRPQDVQQQQVSSGRGAGRVAFEEPETPPLDIGAGLQAAGEWLGNTDYTPKETATGAPRDSTEKWIEENITIDELW